MGLFSGEEVGAIMWESIKNKGPGHLSHTGRAKVEGGWLVCVLSAGGMGVTFLPDPEHKWELGKL